MDINQAYDILNIEANTLYNTAYKRYRRLAKKIHPDKGGDKEKFQELSEAWNTAKTTLIKKAKAFPIITLRKSDNSRFFRYMTSKSENGMSNDSWMDYCKQPNGTYKIVQDDFSDLYIIHEHDKVLQDNVNCKIRIIDGWQDDIEEWIVEFKKS